MAGISEALPTEAAADCDRLYAEALVTPDYVLAEQHVSRRLALVQEEGDDNLLRLLLVAAREGLRGDCESPWPSWQPYLPGEKTLRCVPAACRAQCCSLPGITVRVTALEIRLLQEQEGISPGEFVGRSRLLFKDGSGRCVFLADDNRCHAYRSRPDGCLQYPFKIGYFAADGAGQIVPLSYHHCSAEELTAGVKRFCRKDLQAEIIPLLYCDRACPGVTGPPVSINAYLQLAQDLLELSLCQSLGWPCPRHA